MASGSSSPTAASRRTAMPSRISPGRLPLQGKTHSSRVTTKARSLGAVDTLIGVQAARRAIDEQERRMTYDRQGCRSTPNLVEDAKFRKWRGNATLDQADHVDFPHIKQTVGRRRGLGIPKNRLRLWRWGWDSNPRYACAYNGFRDRPVQPLRHPTADGSSRGFLSGRPVFRQPLSVQAGGGGSCGCC